MDDNDTPLPKYRKGDVLRVRVTVDAVHALVPIVRMNGYDIPVPVMDVIDVERAVIEVGDTVYLRDGAPAEVKAIIQDIDPPQAVLKRTGQWPLVVCKLDEVRR